MSQPSMNKLVGHLDVPGATVSIMGDADQAEKAGNRFGAALKAAGMKMVQAAVLVAVVGGAMAAFSNSAHAEATGGISLNGGGAAIHQAFDNNNGPHTGGIKFAPGGGGGHGGGSAPQVHMANDAPMPAGWAKTANGFAGPNGSKINCVTGESTLVGTVGAPSCKPNLNDWRAQRAPAPNLDMGHVAPKPF